MSEANVEIVKRSIDTYNGRYLDEYDELFTPNYDIIPGMTATIEGRSFRGREGMEAWFAEIDQTWTESRMVTEEIREVGERALWLGRLEGRGRGSGVPVQAPLGAVYDFRDGKASRVRSYLDHGEALRAAGLSE
jgi:ketosteroid isomerase-like protein